MLEKMKACADHLFADTSVGYNLCYIKMICSWLVNTLITHGGQQVAINLMVNQLLGVSSESEVDEMAHLFSDFVDGCLSVPINFPGFAFHTAMKVNTPHSSYNM